MDQRTRARSPGKREVVAVERSVQNEKAHFDLQCLIYFSMFLVPSKVHVREVSICVKTCKTWKIKNLIDGDQ